MELVGIYNNEEIVAISQEPGIRKLTFLSKNGTICLKLSPYKKQWIEILKNIEFIGNL